MTNYTGDIIEESLTDTSILKELHITNTRIEQVTPEHKTPWLKQWTLHTIDVTEDEAAPLAERLSHLLGDNYWYVDYKNDDTHYIIFPHKVFKVDRNNSEEYKPVVSYGLSINIPRHQLDFSPEIKQWERPKPSQLATPNGILPITFVETQQIKEGVVADIYTFDGDSSKDLAIVHVTKGYKTPLQRILKGTKTIEGYMNGNGTFTVTSRDGSVKTYTFTENSDNNPAIETEVHIGELVQWSAETDLNFYEICEPPYEDGRFEDLEES